jgi:hypothetical protein
MEVEPSESRDSVKPILRWPERNEEDTAWTLADGTKAASAKDKLKSEDMTTVRNGKTSCGQKWPKMIRYVITVKLTPDKHDKTRATFGTLPKT